MDGGARVPQRPTFASSFRQRFRRRFRRAAHALRAEHHVLQRRQVREQIELLEYRSGDYGNKRSSTFGSVHLGPSTIRSPLVISSGLLMQRSSVDLRSRTAR